MRERRRGTRKTPISGQTTAMTAPATNARCMKPNWRKSGMGLVGLQRVLARTHAIPQSAGPNDEPDEARGRQRPEAYMGVRGGLLPTENVAVRAERPCREARAEPIWRSQLARH